MSSFTNRALIIALVGSAGVAAAQTQAELADKLNEEGKVLVYEKKFAEASEKFQQAAARVPEAKYFYNLCTSRTQEGKFGEALTACNNAEKNSPNAQVTDKIHNFVAKLREEAKKQGITDLQPSGGGSGPTTVDCTANPQDPACAPQTPPPPICQTNPDDPSCKVTPPPQTNPQPTNLGTVGKPPTENLFVGSKPDNKYTWTLGADLFAGGGQVGQKDVYGTASVGFRIKGDYLLNPMARFGAQGYLQVTHLNEGEMDLPGAPKLDIIDLGIALYKHICLAGTERLCITPLGGVQLAMMSPNGEGDGTGSQVFNYSALGVRLELAAQYAFGRRFEHVLSVGIGTNGYTKVLSGPSDDGTGDTLSAMQLGLDKGGFVGYLGVGYTYRFNTPLGSSPFVTLE